MDKLILLKEYFLSSKLKETGFTLIAAAGFEKRGMASLELVKDLKIQITNSIILKYEDEELNRPYSEKMSLIARSISRNYYETNIGNELEEKLLNILKQEKNQVLVDITCMSRFYIFTILNTLYINDIEYHIIYTEAEEYFPTKKFFDSIYEKASSKEEAFINYLEKEKAPIVYSYNCEIYQDDSFQGNPEPGKPAMLLAFLTYKRSRLQIILQNFEFEKKVFLLSEPVREDLKWRKQYLEIANYDLIQKCNRDIELVETLYPSKVIETLENRSYKSHDYAKYNLMLAPLGSKMQTVGAYFFWRKHPEISVLFSFPKEFFKDSYSKSYKDTFLYCYNDD